MKICGYCHQEKPLENFRRHNLTKDGRVANCQECRKLYLPAPYERTGSKNPNWKGGLIDDDTGRMMVYCPQHPYPNRLGIYVYRYRIVVEKHLGRYLLPTEIVHHKNGIHDDDRIENLEVMSQAEHARGHKTEYWEAKRKSKIKESK